MALTAPQVIDARRVVIPIAFPGGAAVNLTKAQLDTTIATIVTWLENNAASFNTAIAGTPLAGQSAAVKAAIMAAVAVVRYGP